MNPPAYVLVTPVRDEIRTIRRTIESVLRQTCLPREWVIVSDGSTDGTNAVVESASRNVPWIRLLVLPFRPERSFAAVVRALETGVRAIESKEHGYLGLLDADVEFGAEYFERLIRHFEVNARLGMAGGVVVDDGRRQARLPRNALDVPGAVQFFRRECFASLGPLIPLPEGGWDCVTCVVARMRGYETRLVPELAVTHLKPRNVAEGSVLRRQWQLGGRDYALGYAPWFAIAKWLGRVSEPPVLAGAAAAIVGYAHALLRGRPALVPRDVVAFLRREHRDRLWRALTRRRAPAGVPPADRGSAGAP